MTEKTWYCVVETYPDNGRPYANIIRTATSAERPETTYTRLRNRDVCVCWHETLELARDAVRAVREA